MAFGLPVLTLFGDGEQVRYFSLYYFIAIIALVLGTAGCLFLCRKLGKKFAFSFIVVLLFANFALHFVKQFFPLYMKNWPQKWTDSAIPNLCALFVVVSPFIFLWGNKYLKDYLYYIGIASGVLVYFVPTGAVIEGYPHGFADPNYVIEITRFYFCHFVIIAAPILMVDNGFHKLDYHRLWAVPISFTAALAIVALDGILFGPILKVPGYPHDWVGADGILNRLGTHTGVANQSMTFGPQPNTDGALGWLHPYLIPYLQIYYVDGARYFTPVVWLFIPFCLGTAILGPLAALPYEWRHMKLDRQARRQRRAMKKSERAAKN